MLGMMALWILPVVGIAWLVQSLGESRAPGGDGNGAALRILEERFGRGEIDEQEFRAKRALIEGTAT